MRQEKKYQFSTEGKEKERDKTEQESMMRRSRGKIKTTSSRQKHNRFCETQKCYSEQKAWATVKPFRLPTCQ